MTLQPSILATSSRVQAGECLQAHLIRDVPMTVALMARQADGRGCCSSRAAHGALAADAASVDPVSFFPRSAAKEALTGKPSDDSTPIAAQVSFALQFASPSSTRAVLSSKSALPGGEACCSCGMSASSSRASLGPLLSVLYTRGSSRSPSQNRAGGCTAASPDPAPVSEPSEL